MKFLGKKIYITIVLFAIFFSITTTFSANNQIKYKSENISNYFLGLVSLNNNYNKKALKYFKKNKSLKKKHSQFNTEYLKTLVLLDKFDEAFEFSNSIWKEDELFFETDLLLGLESLQKKNYEEAEKYFERLNQISKHNIFFDNFIGNVLLAWSEAYKKNKQDSYKYIDKIPEKYKQLKLTQNIFLKCYFDDLNVEKSFNKLINDKNYDFSRYNFFLINYLLHNKKNHEAGKIIKNSRKASESNLLIKQTEDFFFSGNVKKIQNFFNCKNPQDSLGELFYVIANLYANDKDYKMSNFYLKISLLLNKNFLSNKALLAENYYYQNKYKESKNTYKDVKVIGPMYSWYASKSMAAILIDEKGSEFAIQTLESEFNSLPNKNFEHHYELANFYKNNNLFEKSIKHYSLALSEIDSEHFLVSKILGRRGASYERIDDWKKAEKDLLKSLEILPNQAHTLNYLAYSWVDKGINLDKAFKMLKKATKLKENDGYIIDSLGWAYYKNKNYKEAEFYLQRAVELMPSDPIINDHYADVLWALNKNIQARYFWKYILELKDIKKNLKDSVNKKIMSGPSEQL
ncbi:tetratricopeptide repeat protein [Pelagibacteraceae bacterium]|nr:tetratricopeptide repeat protein [Pelagibacteraceae bacterium]